MSNLVSSPKNVVYVNGGQTYNVSAADDVINVNTTLGATEIVLPNIVNQGLDFYPKKFTVNDTGGAAGTNNITISAVGNQVNSGTSTVLNRNNVSSEVVIVSKTEYLVNTDNGGVSGIFGSGTVGQLAYFSASTVLGSLTNTQVTALLDNFVGDSGSGGTKGLVPAPASGDAAANKYLKADGTWGVAMPSLTNANIFVGNASNVAVSVAMSGDTTISNLGVVTVANNVISNAKLSQVSTQTFKGRATGSTGNVEDLTATQATAILNVMVGDSGSGGTKGLVPAPASGDAAANKYLKADGTWNAISLAGYLKADGSVPLTANWDVGAFEVTAQSLKVDGTAGAGHLHLRYQSSIPSGAANNSKLFASATGSLGWVVDSNAYAFYLDMTGNTASRTLTVPDASGTIALTTDVQNVGTNDLTISNNTRYLRLKSGYTTSQYFQIQNAGGENAMKWLGDGSAEARGQYKFQAYVNGGQELYVIRAISYGGATKVRVQAEDNQGIIDIWGNQLYQLISLNSTGTSYFYNSLALGGSSASARLDVTGQGSTSATTTALFKNSSSSAALTIKDDLTSTFGGVVTAPQIINTPFTVSVSSNAGTVTRSYKNNNFTNSSAAAMTITMSLTGALDGDMVMVRIFDFSAAAQTITWVNTENSTITVPATSNGSTTLPVTVGFQYNGATSKWRCLGSV